MNLVWNLSDGFKVLEEDIDKLEKILVLKHWDNSMLLLNFS